MQVTLHEKKRTIIQNFCPLRSASSDAKVIHVKPKCLQSEHWSLIRELSVWNPKPPALLWDSLLIVVSRLYYNYKAGSVRCSCVSWITTKKKKLFFFSHYLDILSWSNILRLKQRWWSRWLWQGKLLCHIRSFFPRFQKNKVKHLQISSSYLMRVAIED